MERRIQLQQAIAALESQRAILGEDVVETALAPLRSELAKIERRVRQRKQVTVLFADVSGFTALSETMDVEDLNEMMNGLWAQIDRLIIEYGGHIDKHMGDAIMALWGVGQAHEDDPERGVQAALAIQAAVQSFQESHPECPPVRMRVGVHTGLALLDEVGVTNEYTAMGDAINIASYLEHIAPVGGVLISHDTYRHVRGLFVVQPLEPVQAKGRKEPVPVYLVSKAKPPAFRNPSRGIEGVETPLIGREAELERLQKMFFDTLETGTLHVANIVGEAGIGKSRLLSDFRNWLDLQPVAVRILLGRARAETQNVPYALFRNLLAFRFDIHESEDPATMRRKLEEGIVRFMGEEDRIAAHFIGHLIGLDFSDSPHLRGILEEPRQIRDRAFHYISRFFSSIARNGPVAIYLEDVHWADDDSLDLIEHLVRTCPDQPILVLALCRPTLKDRRPAWMRSTERHACLHLDRLGYAESCQLIAEILRPAEEIPLNLIRTLADVAEGIPFYIEELIKVLIEDGVICTEADRWCISTERLEQVPIPTTLTAVIQARLDSLPATERSLLQRASVLGRSFWDKALQALSGPDITPTAVYRSLKDLRERDLIVEAEVSCLAGVKEYMFRHALLQQAVYETLLKTERRALHAQAAAWLTQQVQNHPDVRQAPSLSGMIARHYEQADMVDEAARWYGRAGQQAHGMYAPQTAIEYLQKAIDFAEQGNVVPLAEQIGWHQLLSDVLFNQAQYDQAIATLQKMHQKAVILADGQAQARAYSELAWIYDLKGDHHLSLELACKAEALATGLDRARAIQRRGWAYFRLGEVERALQTGQEALQLCDGEETTAQREQAGCLRLLAAAYMTAGRYDLAQEHGEAALRIYQRLDDRLGVVIMLNNLGEIARLRGDYSSACDHYQASLDTCRAIGHAAGEAILNSNLGAARIGMGDYRGAEINLIHAIEVAGDAHFTLAETYAFLTEAYVRQGKFIEAEEAVRKAIRLAQAQNAPLMLGQAWRALAILWGEHPSRARNIAAGLGLQVQTADECFARSHAVFRQANMAGEQARTLVQWACYSQQTGDCRKANAMRRVARKLFQETGADWEVQRLDAEWKQICLPCIRPICPIPPPLHATLAVPQLLRCTTNAHSPSKASL